MNIQALMKQAQAMQKNLLDSKKEIQNKKYEGESELVKAVVNGKKQLVSIKFKIEKAYLSAVFSPTPGNSLKISINFCIFFG